MCILVAKALKYFHNYVIEVFIPCVDRIKIYVPIHEGSNKYSIEVAKYVVEGSKN